MSDNKSLITELQRIGERALSGNMQNLLNRAAEAIMQAERDLTELGTAFRDCKIVHPEGTR